MQKSLGFFLLLMGVAVNGLAGGVATPEIDPTSASAAVALVTGGLLVIQYRRKK